MPKIVVLIFSLIILITFLVTPNIVWAAPTVSDIGEFLTGQQKNVTVSGLSSADVRYMWKEFNSSQNKTVYSDCFFGTSITRTLGPYNEPGSYTLLIYMAGRNSCTQATGVPITHKDFNVKQDPNQGTGTCDWNAGPPLTVKNNLCTNGSVPSIEGSAFAPQCVCKAPGSDAVPPVLVPSGPGSSASVVCTGNNCSKAGGELCDGDQGIQTAIGCIHTDPSKLIKDLFTLSTGIGGGIAFLFMIFGAFGMITSAGNPESLKAGQQMFVNAIIGILFIVFSTLLLQIIGVNILSIPGFTK
ncbi:MAG: pilin [Candidatus Daviesbacteria bacterium]|nr:pilin [Candidatus Daviesbacteria bacterium]